MTKHIHIHVGVKTEDDAALDSIIKNIKYEANDLESGKKTFDSWENNELTCRKLEQYVKQLRQKLDTMFR